MQKLRFLFKKEGYESIKLGLRNAFKKLGKKMQKLRFLFKNKKGHEILKSLQMQNQVTSYKKIVFFVNFFSGPDRTLLGSKKNIF
jgi:hypothetical protein